MKIQIRKHVFETNSSSTHSVTYFHKKDSTINGPNSLDYVDEFVDEHGGTHFGNYAVAYWGEFGWEVKNYTEPNDKLSYLVTMGMEIFKTSYEQEFGRKWYTYSGDGHGVDKDFIYNYTHSEIFKRIEQAVKDHCNCDGLYFNNRVEEHHFAISENGWYDIEGYIDHQSCEGYTSLDDYLDEWGIDSITDYIFSDNIIVHTDNDNH